MLVVISDLHFSEAQSTQIGPHRYNRNLPVETYRAYFAEINQIAVANKVKQIDFVLAGDILEISRSSIWLEGEFRPYINNGNVSSGSDEEKIILKIIEAIAEEGNVAETLTLFRNIQQFFDVETKLHLILGNHDRLANATPKIRAEVRKIFGLNGGPARIDNIMIIRDEFEKPFCLIRHGHEYDPTNFSLDLRRRESIPAELPVDAYDVAVLGDITTIEYGASLPWLFLKQYGEEAILSDKTLMALYKRLMEFDDVRPSSAWLSFLFTTPGVDDREVWHLLKPAFTTIINTLISHDEFRRTLKQSAAVNPIVRVLLIGILKSRIFRDGIPFWMIKLLMKMASRFISVKSQVRFAKKEALIQNSESGCRCVISGHSHFAEASLISATKGVEKYYINTGTWRNVIPATKNYEQFGRLKALTKVMVFYPWEENDPKLDRDWAFHYMSGVNYGSHRYLQGRS